MIKYLQIGILSILLAVSTFAFVQKQRADRLAHKVSVLEVLVADFENNVRLYGELVQREKSIMEDTSQAVLDLTRNISNEDFNMPLPDSILNMLRRFNDVNGVRGDEGNCTRTGSPC